MPPRTRMEKEIIVYMAGILAALLALLGAALLTRLISKSPLTPAEKEQYSSIIRALSMAVVYAGTFMPLAAVFAVLVYGERRRRR